MIDYYLGKSRDTKTAKRFFKKPWLFLFDFRLSSFSECHPRSSNKWWDNGPVPLTHKKAKLAGWLDQSERMSCCNSSISLCVLRNTKTSLLCSTTILFNRNSIFNNRNASVEDLIYIISNSN